MKKIAPEVAAWHYQSAQRRQARQTRLRKHLKRRMLVAAALRAAVAKRYGKTSRVLSMLAEQGTPSLKTSKKEVLVKVPSRLSVIEDPESAIRLVADFAATAQAYPQVRRVMFDHSELKHYDLAANALLDLVASEIDAQFKLRGSRLKLRCQGVFPRDPFVKMFIRAIGIIKHMEVKHEALKSHESVGIEAFDARRRHYMAELRGYRAGRKDAVAKRFVDHINNCLSRTNKELTDEGRSSLTDYLCEILSNAEDHAGFLDWTLQGYLDSTAEVPICEIAIFNFGKSIAQTFLELDPTSYTWDQINHYLTLHERFRLFAGSWRKADLLTVIALQPDVSTKNITQYDTRGQGTVDLIDFFQGMYEECVHGGTEATMAIVSGGTYIRFDGKYRIAENADGRRVIAFNEPNDLEQRPDSKYVRPLRDLHFPGTIISIKFPLSSAQFVEEDYHGSEESDH